jgi:hypothetical protein
MPAFLILSPQDAAVILLASIRMLSIEVSALPLSPSQRVGTLQFSLGIEILAGIRCILAALKHALLLFVRLLADHCRFSYLFVRPR